MPQHRRLGKPGTLRPSLLKPQLTAQVNETERLLAKGNLLHADQIVMILDLILDLFPGSVDPIDKGRCVIDDLEFPVGSKIVSCTQQPFLKSGIVFIEEIAFKFLRKAALHRINILAQLFQDDGVNLVSLLAHHFMEYRRFDVGQDNSLQELEHPPFYQLAPVNHHLSFMFLQFSKNIGDDNLVRLFIEFREFHGSHVVVPSLNAGRIKQPGNQATTDHLGNSIRRISGELRQDIPAPAGLVFTCCLSGLGIAHP